MALLPFRAKQSRLGTQSRSGERLGLVLGEPPVGAYNRFVAGQGRASLPRAGEKRVRLTAGGVCGRLAATG